MGIGTIIGICFGGDKAIKEFGVFIFLAVFAIIIGVTIVFVYKNKAKLSQLNMTCSDISKKTCPSCGLSVASDCKQCPKCDTKL